MYYHRRTCQNKNMNVSKPCININVNIIELLIELLIEHPPNQGAGVVTMLQCYNVKTFIMQASSLVSQ